MHIKAEHGREGTGVEVILPTPADAPHCVHGPALLFERFAQGDDEHKKFFACSAYRNRKDCSLYVLLDKPWSKTKLEERLNIFQEERKKRKWFVNNTERSDRVQTIRTAAKMQFCQTCSIFVVEPDEPGLHPDHALVRTNYKSVTNPSTLMNALTANEGNAQYLFASETTDFITKLITEKKFSHLLCLGTPRIHEIFSTGKKPKTMLLDLDDRFIQFYPPTVFQHYNMASNFFFEEEGEKYLRMFLKKSKKVALVLDPPFGALARVISNNIDQLKAMVKEINPEAEIIVYWIFPHFLSKHITEVQPTLKMCHFMVEYENHPVFKKNNSTKSPVRIHTDQPLPEITLPDENYKDCEKCKAGVPKEVVHCTKCGCCPPINRATKHCVKCERCVRDHYLHCDMCEGCRPSVHHCKSPSVCHRCQQPGHKRRYCPFITGKIPSGTEQTPAAVVTIPEEKKSDGKSYFTLSTDEEKKNLRKERKRKNKEAKITTKKIKVAED